VRAAALIEKEKHWSLLMARFRLDLPDPELDAHNGGS
jgi:hypothetical protein